MSSQMRSYIDAGVGQELAQSIAVSDFRQLEQMVARMEKAHAKRDAVAYHEINMAFHERMVELVGNRKLLDVYRKLLNELTLYRRQSLAQPGAMDHSAAEHREILAAIKSGEGDAAGRVMRNHIMASSGRLQRAHEAPRNRKTK
jgi:DNA-binding GntR family transcriptional regulator